jgi:PTS system galactitol-specific IIA component
MSPELVFFDVEAADAAELFAKLEPIYLERGLVTPSWIDAINEREKNFPTGLPFDALGVAIPHVEPENIVKPYIAIIKPSGTVRFRGMGGMDDVDAKLIINLGLLAHAEDQVVVLQALMKIFMDEEACADIMAQTTGEDMVATMTKWCEAKAEEE